MKLSVSRGIRLSGRWQTAARIVAGGLIVVPATIGLTACDSAQKALDRGDTCLDILDLALFNPHPASPEQARKDVRERANKIDDIAKKASDKKLGDAARETAQELREASQQDLSPGSVSEYMSEQSKRLKALRKTCTNVHDY